MYVRAEQPERAVPFLRAAVNGIGGGLARNSASYRWNAFAGGHAGDAELVGESLLAR
jgi:hypothetical protein